MKKTEIKKIKYEEFNNGEIIYTQGTNSKKTELILRKLKPDLIVLGQTGIIKKNILNYSYKRNN